MRTTPARADHLEHPPRFWLVPFQIPRPKEENGGVVRKDLPHLAEGVGKAGAECQKESPVAEKESLPSALAANLEGSFERMVLEYQDRLYGFALRLTANPEDAEEIAQDAFVRAYRALKSYGPERIRSLALRAWLYRITLNVARNRLRRKKHAHVSLHEASTVHDTPDDPSERPDSRFEKAQKRADLATLVAALPGRYRTPLILRYVEGLKLEDVAAVLRQPLGTTKSNLHRAINLLRTSISQSRRLGRVTP